MQQVKIPSETKTLASLSQGYLGHGDYISLEIWISNFVFPNVKNVNVVWSRGMCFKPSDRVFELPEVR